VTCACVDCGHGDVEPGTRCPSCDRVQIAEVAHLPVIPEETLAALERIIEGARAGRIVQLVAVADDRTSGEYVLVHATQTAWSMIGALEWAKSHPAITFHRVPCNDPGEDV